MERTKKQAATEILALYNSMEVRKVKLSTILRKMYYSGGVWRVCGRVIFNTATIRGKQDNKTYIVGLTCVKKLLNKSIYFNVETMMDYEHSLYMWNNAMNSRKWINKHQKQREVKGLPPYDLEFKMFKDPKEGDMCYIELSSNGSYQGHSEFIQAKYKSVFDGLKFVL